MANRVTEIAKASDEHQWRYVNTNDNPADMASRGLKVKAFLKKEMWVYGPPFLLGPQEEWPQNPDGWDAISPKDSEVKSITVNAAQIKPEVVDPTTNFIHYFSSWNQLKRAVAWMLRIKGLLLQRIRKRKTASGVLSLQGNLDTHEIRLTIGELENAEIEIIRFCQKKRFGDEISNLKKGMNAKKTSHIHKRNPILDKGVLRVGGRLSRAAVPEEIKHPVILAKDFHIADLILQHIHGEVGHGGRNHMLSRLRQKYWIPGATVLIRKSLSKCVVCRRINATPGQQHMADLPLDSLSR